VAEIVSSESGSTERIETGIDTAEAQLIPVVRDSMNSVLKLLDLGDFDRTIYWNLAVQGLDQWVSQVDLEAILTARGFSIKGLYSVERYLSDMEQGLRHRNLHAIVGLIFQKKDGKYRLVAKPLADENLPF
jgi:hypothetical protein